MVGRAYTMKEMKQIVDYLVEHRAYNEIRGRKMWMDLASSKILDRTWQSVKETFLKRILPDIHNPYYKLTVEQISSFRQEVDITAKNRNRLEIHTISDESTSTSDNQRVKEQTIKKEDEKTGEKKCSKIQNRNRSSTDTLVLENCYETAEDVRKELESSPKSENAQKSLRDFITYSEPLTPMLQEVLHDFSSDDEPQMQIVEEQETAVNVEEQAKSTSSETFRESQSYTKKTENNANDEQNKKDQPSKIKSLRLKKTHKGTWENKEPINDVSSTGQKKETNNNESATVFTCKENTEIAEKTVVPDKNNSNSTTDTPLPNNQEEIANKPNQTRTSTESSNSEFLEPHKKKKEKSRKRSRSQSSTEQKKKKKETKHTPNKTSEPDKNTQTFDSHPQATSLQKKLGNNTLNTQQNIDNQTDDTNISPNVVVENSTGGGNEGTSQEAGPSGISPADINPCLKSVSLFEEQFSQSKYSDSDEDDIQIINNGLNDNNFKPENNNKGVNGTDNSKENITDQSKETTVINKAEPPTTSNSVGFDNVLLLKSHSETSSEHLESPKETHPSANRIQKSKERALANLFGFTSGGVAFKKPFNKTSSRRFSQKQRILSRNQNLDSGSSDDYTTASDSEDDTPLASSRHNGHSRQFKKPPSYDILSHEDGLFVVGRKKIYPLMLRENGSLHYTRGAEDKAAEQADSYWKAKYLDERKKRAEETIRADELARLLRKAKEEEKAKEPVSPILQTKQSFSAIVKRPQPKPLNEIVAAAPNTKPEENVKIKFNRNKEVELEGQWTNLNPILERMVELFNSNDSQNVSKPKQKEAENQAQNEKEIPVQKESAKEEIGPTQNVKPKTKKAPPRKTSTKKPVSVKDSDDSNKKLEEPVVISSGKSTPVTTPVDPEIHKKIDTIESEIFEKIAEIDKTDQSGQENEAQSDTNITKRIRGRPRKISAAVRSSASLDTVPKKRASSIEKIPKKQRALSIEGAAKKPRTSSVGAEVGDPESGEDESGASTSKRFTKPPQKYGSDSNLVVDSRKSMRARSKLSLHKPEEVKSGEVSIPEDDNVLYKFPAKTKKHTKYNIKRSSPHEPLTSPDVSSRHSESTPGYQDSDVTPPNITKRRRRMSTVDLVYKKGLIKRVKRKSCPYLADDDSCSTNESLSQKSIAAPNVSETLNSEVYKSDSYQILMPKAKKLSLLDKIDENTLPNDTEINKNILFNLTSLDTNVNNEYCEASDELLGAKTSEANSSNVSFPLSPELSIVENLTLSKDLIISSVEAPTINETQGNDVELPTASPDKYLISGVDVSMPLMDQDCEIQTWNKKKTRNRRTSFSESFPQEQYSSESLDQRLRDLLLESAKKIAQGHTDTHNNENVMEVDNVGSVKKVAIKKRRSSTPRKKKTVQKSTKGNIDPVIEEHTESCSHGGRKSCPPVIHVIPCEKTVVNVEVKAKPQRGRKKKDVIKVKILRPRSKSRSTERIHTSRLSVCTDSGINGTVSGSSEGCECCDITTELIHNHSDTCLHMDECVGDSVEFVEDANRSVISLNSYSIPSEVQSDKSNASKYTDGKEEFVTPETLCSNARDATSLSSQRSPKILSGSDADDVATEYHTPQSGGSFNSLITDDLSDESKPCPKWYLLSEDDTNFADARSQSRSTTSVGAALNKIFTSCAVPDLSTISERSKENDTKTVINTDTEPDTVSQSLFDLEF